jgi:nucleoside-diphosphate-sugar epimerase
MRAIVTGGAGFLGRSVVRELTDKNWEVTVIDNDSRGDSRLLNNEVAFHKIDIRDQDKIIGVTRNADLLIHLAFVNGTKHFYEKPDLVVDVGIKGMMSVHEAVKHNNIPEIMVFSTSEAYQGSVTIPTPEEVPLTIPDILNPRFSYGGSKIALELVTVHLTSKFVESWKILRPHNIYGPNMGLDHVVPELFHKVMSATSDMVYIEGDGTQTRAFCHIEDFRQAFSLIVQDDAKNQIYNIGTREETSILNLANRIMEIAGKKLNIIKSDPMPGGVLRRCPDITKIERLGFKQKLTLNQGLSDFYDNYYKKP